VHLLGAAHEPLDLGERAVGREDQLLLRAGADDEPPAAVERPPRWFGAIFGRPSSR